MAFIILCLPALLISIAILLGTQLIIDNSRKKLEKINRLMYHGILVKGLPVQEYKYGMVNEANIRGVNYKKVCVVYNNKTYTRDHFVKEETLDDPDCSTMDLLYDPNDEYNYLIEYEIN